MSRRKQSFASEISDRSRECLKSFIDNSPAKDAMSDIISSDEITYAISTCGDAHSKQTLMAIPPEDIMALSHDTNISDGGLPEVIVSLASDKGELVMKVVGTRNMDAASKLKEEVNIPAILTFHGPQSLPGTGIFALIDEKHIPSRIVSHDGQISVPTPAIAVTANNLGLSHDETREMAAAVDGIISIATNTPVHEDSANCDALKKAVSWALRQEEHGELLIGIPDSEIMERAVKIAKPSLHTEVVQARKYGSLEM